jgi:hypothetical protein
MYFKERGWSDGTPWDYTNYGPVETRGYYDCIIMVPSSEWYGVPCGNGYQFVCKI